MGIDIGDIQKIFYLRKNWDFIRETIRKEFAYQVIFGNLADSGKYEDYLALLAMEVYPTVAMVIQADQGSRGPEGKEMWLKRRAMVYEKMVGLMNTDNDGITTVIGRENILAFPSGEQDVTVLLPAGMYEEPGESKRTAKRYGRYIKAVLEKELPFTVSVGIGRANMDFQKIRESYGDACQAIEYKFYRGNSSLIHYSELEWNEKKHQKFFIEHETELLRHIRSGEWDAVKDQSRGMLAKIAQEKSVPPSVLKVRILEMLTVMSRAMIELGVEAEPLLDLKVKIGQDITMIFTIMDMQEWVEEVIEEMCVMLKDRQQAAVKKAVMKVRQHIEDNFHRDLSLDEAAQMVYLSPSYLSHVFAEFAGMSFSECLKEMRIKKAKALLIGSGRTIAEVAEAVGYKDPNYFSRVFKLTTGKTPQQYRSGST